MNSKRAPFGVVLFALGMLVSACQPIQSPKPMAHLNAQGTAVGYGTETAGEPAVLIQQPTHAAITEVIPEQATEAAVAPTLAAEPTPEPVAKKILDWSNLDELQGSTFEFFSSTHVPGNTQAFTGWVSAQDLSERNAEQPKGSIGISTDTDPQSFVSREGGSLLIFLTCRELDPQTGRSANNKRTLIFAVLEGSPEEAVYYLPEILTVHSFNYQGDSRVDWGEQFKILGDQGHPEDELWPVDGAFVLHLANGETLKYNYIAGLNIHYSDEFGISALDVQGTKTTFAEQLKGMLK